MGTLGPGTFDNDAASDFTNEEMRRHAWAIESIFADSQRFRLDEDAEGELMPRIAILALLIAHCGGVLRQTPDDIAAWKARYLEMYDDQNDELEPKEDYKPRRRAVIEASFDQLIRLHEEQFQHAQESWGN